MRYSSLTLLLLTTTLPLRSLMAAEDNDAQLRAMHGTLGITQEQAEYCVEFNHDLDAASLGGATLRLESDHGAAKRAAAVIIDRKLCLPALDYRAHYRLTLSGLMGKDGEELPAPYRTNFAVPERQAALSIAGDDGNFGWQSWPNNSLKLRSINIGKVAVELYRLTSDTDSLEAWRNRSQALYAPQEGAYFAHEKGQLVWQGMLDVPMKPDAMQENALTLPLPAGSDQAGLYFALVKSVDKSIDKSADTANGKEIPHATGLAPVAGSWLLRSDLRLRPLATPDGISILALLTSKGVAVPQLSVRLYDPRQKQVAEAVTDAEGHVHIPSSVLISGETYSLLASTPTGERLVQDIPYHPETDILLPRAGLSMQLRTATIQPAQEMSVTLNSRAGEISDSLLSLVDSDDLTVGKTPIKSGINKPTTVTLVAPAKSGLYTLLWLSNQGHELARQAVRVSPHPAAPRLEITSGSAQWAHDQAQIITLTTRDAADRPAAFRSGLLKLEWRENVTPFPSWHDYKFGIPLSLSNNSASDNSGVGGNGSVWNGGVWPFMTNADGKQKLSLRPNIPAGKETPLLAILTAQGDAGQDLLAPAPITLPLPPRGTLVGIKPQAVNARFLENSIARFSVIAVGPDGRRIAADGLSAQIYAEERSFDWQTTAAGWDYRALPASRRLGGKPLTLMADKDTQIEWPVTSGLYRIDIMNDQKAVVASQLFSAGIPRPVATENTPARDTIQLPKAPLRRGIDTTLVLRGTEAGTASLIVADDKVRIHRTITTTGKTTNIVLRPSDDWGPSVHVIIDDVDHNRRYEARLALEARSGDKSHGDQDDMINVVATPAQTQLSVGDQMTFEIPLRNMGDHSQSQGYEVNAKGPVKLGHSAGTLTLAARATGHIAIPLQAIGEGRATITLKLRASSKDEERQVSFDVLIAKPTAATKDKANEQPVGNNAPPATTIKRRYLNLSGQDVAPAALQAGKNYVTLLTFDNLPATGLQDITLTENTAAGLQATGCPLPASGSITNSWAWWAGQNQMTIKSCRLQSQHIELTGSIAASQAKTVLAYLVTATNKGTFTAPAATLTQVPVQMAEVKVTVK